MRFVAGRGEGLLVSVTGDPRGCCLNLGWPSCVAWPYRRARSRTVLDYGASAGARRVGTQAISRTISRG